MLVGRVEAPPFDEKIIQMLFDVNHWTEEAAFNWCAIPRSYQGTCPLAQRSIDAACPVSPSPVSLEYRPKAASGLAFAATRRRTLT